MSQGLKPAIFRGSAIPGLKSGPISGAKAAIPGLKSGPISGVKATDIRSVNEISEA
jgi:hypothetical protein